MGEDWRKATGGAVTLRIYPGGVVGDEKAMIRKMRVGQLQAATVTGLGLASLDKSFYALLVPMMFADDGELDRVRERLAPMLERQLEQQGFVVLAWGDAGWISFFTKTPVTRPAEVMATKLFVGTDDSTVVQLYKETGFNPVQLSAMDILPGLQTGTDQRLRGDAARRPGLPVVRAGPEHDGPQVRAAHRRDDHRQADLGEDPGGVAGRRSWRPPARARRSSGRRSAASTRRRWGR